MEPPDPYLIASGKDLAELAIKGWIGKELLEKLLGPTAAYVGDETKALAQKCNVNVSGIIARAVRKLGSRIDTAGQVNPRILRGIISDGAFTEDEVAAEYFGGVLASSRTEDGRDDRGVAFLALIRDLSTYQLRLHYLFYRSVRRFFRGQQLVVGVPADRARMRLFIPLETFGDSVGATSDQLGPVLEHTIHGLARSGLIEGPYYFGRKEYIQRAWSEVTGPGMLLVPSAYGAELFLWAHGLGHLPVRHFLDQSANFEQSDEQEIPPLVVAVPQQEDVAALKRQIEKANAGLDGYVGKMEAWLNERQHLPAFPNDLREHIRYIARALEDLPNDVAAFLLERDLEAALEPPQDASQEERIELVKTIGHNLSRLLKKPQGDGTA